MRFHLLPALLIFATSASVLADETTKSETAEDKATREKLYRLNAEKYKSKTARRATRALHPYLLLGEAVVWQSGPEGGERALRAAGGVLATTALTEVLKRVVGSERPDKSNRKSFPSGHASSSFAMATAVADYEPKGKWLAYSGAAIISWSRVKLNRHRWEDIAAGAVLGHVVTRQFTRDHARETRHSPSSIAASRAPLWQPAQISDSSITFESRDLASFHLDDSEQERRKEWMFTGKGVGYKVRF
jgi:membrane-associated phospholipid phosphatase